MATTLWGMVLLQTACFQLASSSSSAWNLAVLDTGSSADFHELVIPLSLMERLAYTATFGSYYNASEANATVVGWTRGLTANPRFGMRALLFLQPSTNRGVIAFRGTDLNESGKSGQADACADALLFGSVVPKFCSEFDAHTLDYWGRAVDFVSSVRDVHPQIDLLYTGHSLGAALGMMCAGAGEGAGGDGDEVLPAVVFSSPSWRDALANRTGLRPTQAHASGRLYALADAADPVQQSHSVHELLGSTCIYPDPHPPIGCDTCFESRGIPSPLRAAACDLCASKTHIYSHYVYDLIPGPRPPCVNITLPVWPNLLS
eukprot:m.17152 g.17152  ORF g.17152 m.17152 type:complete len:317 (-) comp11365_c0_seq1:248-1198(-)